MSNEINEYSMKLNAAQMKIHELNTAVLYNLKQDLRERDNTIAALKTMITSYNNNAKTKEYIIERKNKFNSMNNSNRAYLNYTIDNIKSNENNPNVNNEANISYFPVSRERSIKGYEDYWNNRQARNNSLGARNHQNLIEDFLARSQNNNNSVNVLDSARKKIKVINPIESTINNLPDVSNNNSYGIDKNKITEMFSQSPALKRKFKYSTKRIVFS